MTNKQLINEYILKKVKDGNLDADMSLMILKELNGYKRFHDDIAIIGMSCKFPQADNCNEFWNNIKNGAESTGTFPEERRRDMGREIGLKAGWLQHIADFDAGFFRISPKEATMMNPSQRLFLEESWKALEDAGYCNKEIDKANVGVYVGIDHSYLLEYVKKTDAQDLLSMTGSMTSVLASRIAFALNLHGPNMVIDTACSSGLVCTHLACMAIKNGECDMALAGGLHILGMIDAKFDGVDSKNGKLSSFDKNSQGTVWGEGMGFIVLKPLKLAMEDGDHIYAVIKGTAVNNDGKTNTITSPSSETQAEVIVKAWENAKVNPEELSYIEAHATGTVLGDPIEVKGLKMAFEKYTDRKQFCAIGSVKPNIGHGVSSASMSSLIKVILALKEKKLPPNINFQEPNPFIQFQDSPVYVSDKLRDWIPNGKKRLAGVSSFGFGRTNVHIVLEEAPEKEADITTKKWSNVFTLSAKTRKALEDYIVIYKKFVKENLMFSIDDLCYTANIGRLHHRYRLALIVKDKEDLINKLDRIDLEQKDDGEIFSGYHKVVTDNSSKNMLEDITENEKRKLTKRAGELTVNILDNGNECLKEICRLYSRGAEVNWKLLYQDKKYRRISIPTYPFQHKHYWLDLSAQPASEMKEKPLNPLIDKLAVSTEEQDIYVTKFEIGKQWILTEHLIYGSSVIPGTAYIEMIMEACQQSAGRGKLQLRDIVFYTPVVVNQSQVKEVQTIVKHEQGHMSVKVISKEDDGSWITHVIGKVFVLEEDAPEKIDLQEVRKRCSISKLEIDLTKENGGFKFGPRWRNIKDIHIGNGEILTEIEIDSKYEKDVEDFTVHPAMIDNAINLAAEVMVQTATHKMFLPFSYKDFKLYQPLPGKFYSYQVLNNKIVDDMTAINIDITLVNETGQVLGKIEKYTIKRVEAGEINIDRGKRQGSLYHHIVYRQNSLQFTGDRKKLKTVLMIGVNRKKVQEVKEACLKAADRVVYAELGKRFEKIGENHYVLGEELEDYQMLADELDFNSLSLILHACCYNDKETVDSLNELKQRKEEGLISLLKLVKALSGRKIAAPVDMILLSNNVYAVKENSEIKNPMGASLFALGRVVKHEYKKLHVKSVDIEPDTDIEQIMDEIYWNDLQYTAVYRKGKRFTEVIEEFDVNACPEERVEIKDDGVYIITGGMDGIACEAAKTLCKKARPNIAFICRSKIPEKKEWNAILQNGEDTHLIKRIKAIRELEKLGAKISAYSCDVTDEKGMEQVIADLKKRFSSINGIFHGAGIPGRTLILKKDCDTFQKVTAPKVEGTWLLEHLTKEESMDFFIMFSSILSIMGPSGQSDYASANAFMNAFAGYGRKQGKKMTTLSWSVWSETGMALDFKLEELRGLFECVTNKEGMEAIENALYRTIIQASVGAFDYNRLSESGGDIGIDLDDSVKEKLTKKKIQQNKVNRPVKNIKINSNEKITETQIVVANIWAVVLGLDELSVYDSFSEYGGDSIIATQLVNALNETYPDIIDISDIFTYPTVKQLAEYIDECLDPDQKQEEEYTVEKIMSMMDAGEITIETADKMLQKIQE